MDRIFKATSHAVDPMNLTEQEKNHVPMIELPAVVTAKEMFPVTIKVGQLPHVMDPGHYIQFIDLYAGQTFLSRVTFTPIAPMPKVTHFMVLTESTKLRAVVFCNLDGFWEAERWISVE
jgi:superoxide reductase